jgi:hypothetical protein
MAALAGLLKHGLYLGPSVGRPDLQQRLLAPQREMQARPNGSHLLLVTAAARRIRPT